MMTNYGLGAMMNYGHIRLYSGPQPASPDFVPTGTYLGYISTDGDEPVPGSPTGGLLLGYLGDGELREDSTWVLKGVANGTIGWWRFVWNAEDDDSASTFYPRIDGAAGESLKLSSYVVEPTTVREISEFRLWLPTGA
jgi:hypothetical protein